MPPRDTSKDAFAAQLAQLRNAGPAARLAMAADMSDAVVELAAEGTRRRHPDYDAAQVAAVLGERLHEQGPPRSRTSST
jgi:hypothetical protein